MNCVLYVGKLLNKEDLKVARNLGYYCNFDMQVNGTVRKVQAWDNAAKKVQEIKKNTPIIVKGYIHAFTNSSGTTLYSVKSNYLYEERNECTITGVVKSIQPVSDTDEKMITIIPDLKDTRNVQNPQIFSYAKESFIEEGIKVGDKVKVFGQLDIEPTKVSLNFCRIIRNKDVQDDNFCDYGENTSGELAEVSV